VRQRIGNWSLKYFLERGVNDNIGCQKIIKGFECVIKPLFLEFPITNNGGRIFGFTTGCGQRPLEQILKSAKSAGTSRKVLLQR
jgi:hypothetical protein